jgi:DNA-directed RNA polymerase subunit E'/Rpb7
MNNMDPLFERRELVKTIHIHSKFLQRNIHSSILAQVKMMYEGRCSAEGFIQRNSITIIRYSLGRANYIKGGIDYNVTFQADICMPHIGQRFRAPVKLRSKIGIHAETPPVKVLIPRDLHFENEEFNDVKVDDDIEFEVIGSQFKQQDDTIIVVGKLLTKVAPNVEMPLIAPTTITEDEEIVKPFMPTETEGEKKVVFTPVAVPGKTGTRRKLKKPDEASITNDILAL